MPTETEAYQSEQTGHTMAELCTCYIFQVYIHGVSPYVYTVFIILL